MVCWGENRHGQLGLGHNEPIFEPEENKFFENKKIVDITCGVSNTVFVTEE